MKTFVVLLLLAPGLFAAIPDPGGQRRVGTRVLGTIENGVVAQLWYPTPSRKGTRAPYVPDAGLIDHLKKSSSAPDVVESWRSLRIPALLDAPIARGRFPVVFFLQGMGFHRAFYSTWAMELASRGHVVVTMDHPAVANGEAANDPAVPARRVAEMAGDVERVLTWLLASPYAKHLAPKRVFVTGHSLGGAAALESCRTSKRVRACADLDGSVWGTVETEGVDRPFLLVLNVPDFPNPGPRMQTMGKQRREEWKAVIEKQTEPATLLLVSGTNPSASATPRSCAGRW